MTYLLNNKISYSDTSNITASSRLRTADARLLLESRYMYGSGTSVEMNDKLVGAGTLVADQPRNCYLANLTTASGDRVIRQTKQYAPYIVGTSNLGTTTFTFNAPKPNLKQSVGFFDDLNGFIFRMNGSIPEMVIRKNGVDIEVIPQSAWNLERFDGTHSQYNLSGINANWTKTQIFTVDYQWVGVGRVRVGFNMNSEVHIVHEFFHANSLTEVYMNNPSLPLRWEIENVGVTSSPSTLMMICGAIYCEGADIESGFSRSVSTDGSVINLTSANAVSNGRGILAFRLKNTLVGKPNHALARLKNWTVFTTEDIQYKVVVLPSISYVAGAPTFTQVPGYGWCEYIKDFALTPGWQSTNEYHVILDTFAPSGGGTGSNILSGTSPITSIDNKSNAIYQNYDSTDSQIMAIIGYRLSTNSIIKASMNWVEVK